MTSNQSTSSLKYLKVSDFGLGENMYTTGYFCQEKSVREKLPYKWMSPESLEDGVFSEKSDVVCHRSNTLHLTGFASHIVVAVW